jgi:hypothetical protein
MAALSRGLLMAGRAFGGGGGVSSGLLFCRRRLTSTLHLQAPVQVYDK